MTENNRETEKWDGNHNACEFKCIWLDTTNDSPEYIALEILSKSVKIE